MGNPISTSDNSENEIIGYSEENRPLVITHLKTPATTLLKVFIIAGQHGDEKIGRKAVNQLISLYDSYQFDELSLLHLAILSDANPDGSSRKTRGNAAGIDMNRDHLRLDSKETRTIHAFVRNWKPHTVIDVHNFRARQKHLPSKKLLHYYDVMIDAPTNPVVNKSLTDPELIGNLLRTLKLNLKRLHFTCERYIRMQRSGRVRHSTADITDARNSLSLRYNIFTILLEGRKPLREEGKTIRKRVILAQYYALHSILRWIQRNMNRITDQQHHDLPSQGQMLAIRSQYRLANEPLPMKFKNSLTGDTDLLHLANYAPLLGVSNYVVLPFAYAVPMANERLLEILERHGFTFYPSKTLEPEHVQVYDIDLHQADEKKSRRYRTQNRVLATIREDQRILENFYIFPINQEGGRALAIFLEPMSRYGLIRYNDLGLQVEPGFQYPILRIMKKM